MNQLVGGLKRDFISMLCKFWGGRFRFHFSYSYIDKIRKIDFFIETWQVSSENRLNHSFIKSSFVYLVGNSLPGFNNYIKSKNWHKTSENHLNVNQTHIGQTFHDLQRFNLDVHLSAMLLSIQYCIHLLGNSKSIAQFRKAKTTAIFQFLYLFLMEQLQLIWIGD